MYYVHYNWSTIALSCSLSFSSLFDKALQQEALRSLTDRKSNLIADGIIDKEITTVLTSKGVKEVKKSYIECQVNFEFL